MSELILIAKNRKSGKWELLITPDDKYEVQLRAYQKFAITVPANDEYVRVLSGRIQPTSTPLTFLTTEEHKARVAGLANVSKAAVNAGSDAAERQKKLTDEQNKKISDAHADQLDEKNALVNSIRGLTNQDTFKETTTERQRKDFLQSLKDKDPKRPSDVLTARLQKIQQQEGEAEAARLAGLSVKTGKTISEIQAEEKLAREEFLKKNPPVPANHAEELAQKNALIESTKKLISENLPQKPAAEAEKPKDSDNKK